MYQKTPAKKSKLRYLFIATCSMVILAAGAIVLEKTGTTNFYSLSPAPSAQQQAAPPSGVPSAQPTNTVDYSAPDPSETVPIADKEPNPTTLPTVNPDLGVVVTSTRKSGDLYLIKAVITGTDTASCSATLSRGSLSATASSDSAVIEGQLSCKDLSVPLSQLSESGEWNLELTVTDKSGATASTNEKVIL